MLGGAYMPMAASISICILYHPAYSLKCWFIYYLFVKHNVFHSSIAAYTICTSWLTASTRRTYTRFFQRRRRCRMPPNTHHNHRAFIIGAIYSCSSGKAFDVFKDFSINKNETMFLRGRRTILGKQLKVFRSICVWCLHWYWVGWLLTVDENRFP